ncbi:hypothetical protein PSH79_14270 [Pseudomonas sp. FP2196]|uniref:hypothetical protein n=1 Tax=Pseudomonas sp. FP2196 TaxID=2954086 RepID=UPI002734B5FC|nr:hypothetical protein [Pseudomonas sp. FP2196]WLH33110.1 hypothetical protein PSH79_14270 [Pseudomonas sp. FP2196]
MIAGIQKGRLSGCAELLWLSDHEVAHALTPSLASQLPQVSAPVTKSSFNPNPVGVSLLAMASAQSILMRQTHRYREQAHSYKGLCVVTTGEHSLNLCGSWLASDGGVSGNISVG